MMKNIFKNPYFKVALVYCISHFFLLILSGCWWDDWTFMTHNLGYVNAVASESGRPEWNILIPFCWSLPNNGRPLIFLMYLCNSLFVYDILSHSKLFNDKQSLIISFFYSFIPVNDARLLISNFSYSTGLFFFHLALMLFVRWNNSDRKILYRIGILLLFYIGFILNSLLAYYYFIFVYLFILDFINNTENNFIKKVFISVINVLKTYPDFFVLPFAYYIVNKTLFPTHGPSFDNYNAVTLESLVKCVLYIPLTFINYFISIFRTWYRCIGIVSIILILLLLIYVIKRNIIFDKNNYQIKQLLFYLLGGIFLIVWGIFPYVVVRMDTLSSIGVKGRDAILTPLGISIVLYSILSIFKPRVRTIITSVLLILGLCGFNYLYIEWQKDYYLQLSMEELFRNPVIKDNDTFFLIDLNETEIEGQRFYSLNTNAYHVYNDQTRLFIPKVSNLIILMDDDYLDLMIRHLDYANMMRDYKPEDHYFDAILNYKNNYSFEDTIKLKYYELFNTDKFNEIIKSNGKLDIVVVEDEFTKKLISEYKNGNISSDEDVLDLLIQFGY